MAGTGTPSTTRRRPRSPSSTRAPTIISLDDDESDEECRPIERKLHRANGLAAAASIRLSANEFTVIPPPSKRLASHREPLAPLPHWSTVLPPTLKASPHQRAPATWKPASIARKRHQQQRAQQQQQHQQQLQQLQHEPSPIQLDAQPAVGDDRARADSPHRALPNLITHAAIDEHSTLSSSTAWSSRSKKARTESSAKLASAAVEDLTDISPAQPPKRRLSSNSTNQANDNTSSNKPATSSAGRSSNALSRAAAAVVASAFEDRSYFEFEPPPPPRASLLVPDKPALSTTTKRSVSPAAVGPDGLPTFSRTARASPTTTTEAKLAAPSPSASAPSPSVFTTLISTKLHKAAPRIPDPSPPPSTLTNPRRPAAPASSSPSAPAPYISVERNQEARQNMTGVSCKQCERFYALVGAGKDTEDGRSCEHVASRHRYEFPIALTPPSYWDVSSPGRTKMYQQSQQPDAHSPSPLSQSISSPPPPPPPPVTARSSVTAATHRPTRVASIIELSPTLTTPTPAVTAASVVPESPAQPQPRARTSLARLLASAFPPTTAAAAAAAPTTTAATAAVSPPSSPPLPSPPRPSAYALAGPTSQELALEDEMYADGTDFSFNERMPTTAFEVEEQGDSLAY